MLIKLIARTKLNAAAVLVCHAVCPSGGKVHMPKGCCKCAFICNFPAAPWARVCLCVQVPACRSAALLLCLRAACFTLQTATSWLTVCRDQS